MADGLPPGVQQTSMATREFIKVATLFQLGLAALGVYGGVWHGFHASGQTLTDLDLTRVAGPALAWGTLGTIPLLGILVIDKYVPFGPFQHIQKVVKERIYPLLKDCTILQMVYISLLAGSTEEILFRWCLQGGLAQTIPGPVAGYIALFVASLLFGAVHCINFSYALLTFVVGLYLGGLMILSETWLAPAIAHALYDFVAIYVIARVMPRNNRVNDGSE